MEAATEVLRRAEEALTLSEFSAAEQLGRQCLQKAAYLPASDVGEIKDRAATVALQALAETSRFGSARKLLLQNFGPRLEDTPPHSLLLWLALALDTDDRSEAQRLMLTLLDSRQPGSLAGFSRRQYLALVHLHVFEVVLRQMREVAEVMRWVEKTKLPLSAEERQLLLQELAEEEAARRQQQGWQQQQQQVWQQQGQGERQEEGQQHVVEKREAGQQRAQHRQVPRRASDQTSSKVQQQQGFAMQAAERSRRSEAEKPAAAASAATAAPTAAEIVPAADEDAAETSKFEASLDWLGRLQRQALQLVGAALQPLLPPGLLPPPAPERGQQLPGRGKFMSDSSSGALVPPAEAEAPDPAATLRLLGGTALGVVLLYAAYVERQAIRAGVRRTRRRVAAAAGDLLRMAFSMQVNPLAAAAASPAAPGWR